MKQTLREDLYKLMKSKKFLFFALGNEMRGDDYLGILLAERIREVKPEFATVIAYNVPINFLGKVTKANPELIIILDAVDIELDPGTIVLMEKEAIIEKHSSTHFHTLSDFFNLINAQLEHSPKIHVLGIQIKSNELFKDISPEVNNAIEALVKIIKSL